MLRNLRQYCQTDISAITSSKTPDKCSANPPMPFNVREILQRGDEEILIAVMGVTGSGKSYFCHAATGSDKFRVSDELDSCMYIFRVNVAAVLCTD